MQQFAQQLIHFVPRLSVGIVLLVLFWVISMIVRWLIERLSTRANSARQLLYRILARTAKAIILIVGFITALGTMGINVSALVAGLGLTGFALGFAFKDALSNILAGFMILFYQPFSLGDQVSIVNFNGEVIDINLRYTKLHANSDLVQLPNSIVLNSPLVIHHDKRPA